MPRRSFTEAANRASRSLIVGEYRQSGKIRLSSPCSVEETELYTAGMLSLRSLCLSTIRKAKEPIHFVNVM